MGIRFCFNNCSSWIFYFKWNKDYYLVREAKGLRVITEIIITIYGLLMIYTSFFIRKKVHQSIWLAFFVCGVSLVFAVYLPSTILLITSFVSLSFVSWMNASEIAGKRNVTHHLIRLTFHFVMISLWVISDTGI